MCIHFFLFFPLCSIFLLASLAPHIISLRYISNTRYKWHPKKFTLFSWLEMDARIRFKSSKKNS